MAVSFDDIDADLETAKKKPSGGVSFDDIEAAIAPKATPPTEPPPAPVIEATKKGPVGAALSAFADIPSRLARGTASAAGRVAAPIAAPVDEAIAAVDESIAGPIRRNPLTDIAIDFGAKAMEKGADRIGAGRYAKDVVAGGIQTLGSAAGAARVFGFENAGSLLDQAAKTTAKELMPPDPGFSDQVAAGFGSMAAFMVPGYGVQFGAAKMAVFAPRLAQFLGVATSAVLEAAAEGGEAANSILEKTGNKDEAIIAGSRAFWANVPLVYFTNKIGLFGSGSWKKMKAVESALVEGGQEASQTVIGNFAAHDPILQGVLESFGVGAITGGVVGGGRAYLEGKAPVAPAAAENVPAGPQMTNPIPSDVELPMAGAEPAQDIPPAVQEAMARTGIEEPAIAASLIAPPASAEVQTSQDDAGHREGQIEGTIQEPPRAPPRGDPSAGLGETLQDVQLRVTSDPRLTEISKKVKPNDIGVIYTQGAKKHGLKVGDPELSKKIIQDGQDNMAKIEEILKSDIELNAKQIEKLLESFGRDLLYEEIIRERESWDFDATDKKNTYTIFELLESRLAENETSSFYEPEPSTDEERAVAKATAEVPTHLQELTKEGIDKRFPGAPEETRQRLLESVEEGRNNYLEKAAKAEMKTGSPVPLLDLARELGVNPKDQKGELDNLKNKQILRDDGLAPDLFLKSAKEAGILPEDADLNALYARFNAEVALGPKKNIKPGEGFRQSTTARGAGDMEKGPAGKKAVAMRVRARAQALMPEESAASLSNAKITVGGKAAILRNVDDPVFGKIKKGTEVTVVAADLEGGSILVEYTEAGKELAGSRVAVVPMEAVADVVRAEKAPTPKPAAVKAAVEKSTGVKPKEDEILISGAKALREVLRASSKAAREAGDFVRRTLTREMAISNNWSQAIRNKVVAYAKDVLPDGKRGAVLSAREWGALLASAAKAKSPQDLFKAFRNIDKLADKLYRKGAMADIKILAERMLEKKWFPVELRPLVREVIEDVRLENWSQKTLDRLQAQSEFIDHLRATGENVDVPKSLLEEIGKLAKRPLSELAREDLDDIRDHLTFLLRLGKDVSKSKAAVKEMRRQEDLDELLKGASSLNMGEFYSETHSEKHVRGTPALSWWKKTKNEINKVIDFFQEAGVYLDAVQAIATHESDAAYRIIYKRIQRAFIPVVDEMNKASDSLEGMIEKHGLLNDEERFRIIIVAVRDQNDVRPHLHKMDVTDEEIDSTELSSKEQAYLDWARALFNDPKHKKMLARAAAEIEGREFVPEDNYFPLMFTKERKTVTVDAKTSIIEDVDMLRKNVNRGQLIERQAGAARELRTDFESMVLETVRKGAVIKHLAVQLLESSSLIGDTKYLEARGAMRQEFWKEYIDVLARWGHRPMSRWEGILNSGRKNLAKAVLSFKPHIGLLQLSSFGNIGTVVGGENMADALSAGPEWDGFVDGNMPLIYGRKGGGPGYQEILSGANLSKIDKAAFYHIIEMDHFAAERGALAAYFQYLDQHGLPRDPKNIVPEGLAYAQGVVGSRMASPWLLDMPLALSRGGVLAKSLLQFQSEGLSKFSILRHDVLGKRGGSAKDRASDLLWLGAAAGYATGVRGAWVTLVLGILYGLGAITKKQYDDQVNAKNLIWKSLMLEAASALPAVGGIASSMTFGSSPVPILSVGSDVFKGGIEMAQGIIGGKRIKAQRGLVKTLTATAAILGVRGSGIVGYVARQPTRGIQDKKAKKSGGYPL